MTLSIRLNHTPPFTPCSRASSMRSVQIERSTQSHSCGRVSPVCLAELHTGTGVASSEVRHNSSTFLRPLAPPALPGFFATMGALTPVRPAYHRPCTGQVSLVHMARPSLHSVTNHLTRSAIALCMPSQRDGLPGVRTLSPPRSGLRRVPRGSPLRPAESCSSSYGLQVRLRLLSTPPHGDAVTFGYRERASPGRGLSPLRSRLLPGALGRASVPANGMG